MTFLAVFYYDWLDSLPLEITEIWIQRFSLTKLLYLLARYIPFISWIVQNVFSSTLDPLGTVTLPQVNSPFRLSWVRTTSVSYIGWHKDQSPAACGRLYALLSFSTIIGRLASLGKLITTSILVWSSCITGLFALRIWAIFPRNRYILPGLFSLVLGLFIWAVFSIRGHGVIAHRYPSMSITL